MSTSAPRRPSTLCGSTTLLAACCFYSYSAVCQAHRPLLPLSFVSLNRHLTQHSRTYTPSFPLIQSIGEVAIGAVFSIAACAAFIAFTTPIFIRVFFVGNRFRPGPWNLGRFSLPIGAIASAFVALMVPILCFPSVTGSDLDASTMNWTCLVYGGPMVSTPHRTGWQWKLAEWYANEVR